MNDISIPHTDSNQDSEHRIDPEVVEIPLLEMLWRLVLQFKWSIIAIVLGCLFIGLVGSIMSTPLYTSSSRIEISRKQENVTNVEGVTVEDFAQDQEFYQTQYSLLKARSLAQRVGRALNLSENKSFREIYGLDESTEKLDLTPKQIREQEQKTVTDILSGGIEIAPIRGSSLVDVQYTSPDPELAKLIANKWVDEFIGSRMDRRFATTEEARKFLENQLDDLRSRLEESERRLVGYASSKRIVTLESRENADGRTTERKTLTTLDLEALNRALAAAKASRLAAESAAQNQRQARKSATGNSALNGLRQQRAVVASERAKQLAIFEPEYPAVQALTAQLKEIDAGIAREEARVGDNLNQKYREALSNEAALSQRVEQLKGQFISERGDEIQYNIYQREVDTNRQLYDSLLQRYKEIGVAGIGANTVGVVDRALTPEGPSSPNMLLNLALSIIFGVFLSFLYIFARVQVDRSVKDPETVQSLLGLAPLGTIPDIGDMDLLESLNDRKSIASEAYSSITTQMKFLTDHGVPKSMLFTSTRPNEGKTTSAYALALALARLGKKTLIVDGDLRNPSLGFAKTSDRNFGLSNFLSGDDISAGMINDTGFENLKVLNSGKRPPNPVELLSNDRLSLLVELLGRDFDHIVFDAPPVLGLADIPLMASSVEGVVYTIEANGPRVREINSAIRRIKQAHGRIFGAIVTKLDSRNAAYGYGYGYGYGYDYNKQPD
jgi:polysaccharide biosynthesis transport protein